MPCEKEEKGVIWISQELLRESEVDQAGQQPVVRVAITVLANGVVAQTRLKCVVISAQRATNLKVHMFVIIATGARRSKE